MGKDLLIFLTPAFDGSVHAWLQITFALVFLAAVILTSRAVSKAAQVPSWNRNLAAMPALSGTDTYRSAEEIDHAAETSSERWADIVPSLLLVFGLLGTFIGLGLALTEAAGALTPGKDALSSLTPIMDSLGSKFKTSTWGILAFLILKVWFMRHPYEKRRRLWAMQTFIALSREHESKILEQRAQDRQQMLDTVAHVGTDVVAHQQQSTDLAMKRHTQFLDVLQAMAQQQREASQRQQDSTDAQLAILEKLSEQQGQMEANSQASLTAMRAFTDSVSNNISIMASAADSMANAAQASGKASADLGEAIMDFRSTMTDVLGNIRSGLSATIDGMGVTFASNMKEMSGNLSSATGKIEQAIVQLSSGVSSTITMLEKASGKSIEQQAKAQTMFTASGDTLNASMEQMQSFVGELQKKIEMGLSSVASTGKNMTRFEKQIEASNENITKVVAGLAEMSNKMNASQAALEHVKSIGVAIEKLVHGLNLQHAAESSSMRHDQQLQTGTQIVLGIRELTDKLREVSERQKANEAGTINKQVLTTLESIETKFDSAAEALRRQPFEQDAEAA